MNREINLTEIIIRNLFLISGLYLVVLYQTEITPIRLIGFALVIFGFNAWMLEKRRDNKTDKALQ